MRARVDISHVFYIQLMFVCDWKVCRDIDECAENHATCAKEVNCTNLVVGIMILFVLCVSCFRVCFSFDFHLHYLRNCSNFRRIFRIDL